MFSDKKLIAVLVFVGVLVLGGAAQASISTPWVPNDGDVNGVRLSGTEDLYIYDKDDGISDNLLFVGATGSGTVYFTLDSGTWYAGLTPGAKTLDLGPTNRFGFFFGNPSNPVNYSYSVVYPDKIYRLISANSTVLIEVDAKPVPVPGAAFLLGSGLLGLLGIRTRRQS